MAYGDYNYSAPTDYMGRPQADPLLRTAIRARNYSERMAPSQLGPYGSLGGSGGRAAGLAALAQREAAKPQNVFTEQGRFSRPGMTFQQKMDEVRRNIALAGGYTRQKNAEILGQAIERTGPVPDPVFQGGMNDSMVPDAELTPVQRQTMWHTPEDMAIRNANKAAQQERMRKNSELRKQLFADRVRNMYGRVQGAPQGAAPQGSTGSGNPRVDNPTGWKPADNGATADERTQNLDEFVQGQDFDASPADVGKSMRSKFRDAEIYDFLNRNSGLLTEGTFWSTVGDYFFPGESDELKSQRRYRQYAEEALKGRLPNGKIPISRPVGRSPVSEPGGGATDLQGMINKIREQQALEAAKRTYGSQMSPEQRARMWSELGRTGGMSEF